MIPRSTYHKTEFESEYIKKSLKKVLSNDVQFFIAPNQKIYCNYFKERDSSITTFRLETFDSTGQLLSMLKTKRLTYVSELDKWRTKQYETRTFVGDDEVISVSYTHLTLPTILLV